MNLSHPHYETLGFPMANINCQYTNHGRNLQFLGYIILDKVFKTVTYSCGSNFKRANFISFSYFLDQICDSEYSSPQTVTGKTIAKEMKKTRQLMIGESS